MLVTKVKPLIHSTTPRNHHFEKFDLMLPKKRGVMGKGDWGSPLPSVKVHSDSDWSGHMDEMSNLGY